MQKSGVLATTQPIIPGFHPDPSICRVGDVYYLVTSSFEYFPGVPIFKSSDLFHWEQLGYCLTRHSQLDLMTVTSDNLFANTPGFDRGIYAPTLRYHDDWFYMVTTNVNHGRHFWVNTQNPEAEWSEPIWIEHDDLGATIDPSLFFDDDGTCFFTCRSLKYNGIVQFAVDIETGKQSSDLSVIWTDQVGKDAEGPHLYKINGIYYLLVAEGGTEYGHLIAAGRSNKPNGPFEPSPHNPLLTHRSLNHPVQAVGHGDLIETADHQWWCVCLGVRPNGYPPAYHLGRETFIAPVRWTADDWFSIGDEDSTSLDVAIQKPSHEFDTFDTDHLRLAWNFLRANPVDAWSLTERPGCLRLKGLPASLDDDLQPIAFVGRRQQHFDCVISTKLEFFPENPGEEAGITVFMNASHHYDIYVTLTDNGHRCVQMRRRIGSLQAIVGQRDLDDYSPIILRILATANLYSFSYATGEDAFAELASGETRYLSTDVAGGFVGVFIGLYASGNSSISTTNADFDWFEYKSLIAAGGTLNGS